MKTRVIRNEVRDLSKARGSRYVLRVIRAPLVRSLGSARDDRVVCLAPIAKAAAA